MSARIAILGTGRMGSAIAQCLAGFEPTLWNRTRFRAEQVGVGRVAATPADAARDADIVILSLTGADAVRAALAGPDGALTATHGQLFIEMSTSGPAVLEEVATQLRASGSSLIDAPIMGAPAVVLRGAAAILAGGASDDVARARPVLEEGSFMVLEKVCPFPHQMTAPQRQSRRGCIVEVTRLMPRTCRAQHVLAGAYSGPW